MRLVKMLGLAAVAAVAAMAIIGATSASATTTMLCAAHGELTCSVPATTVGMVNEGVGRLLSSLATVLCLTIEGAGTPLGSGSPQQVHITELSFTSCGTNSAHNNCEIEVLELPLANLLKTGLDSGTLEGTNGETLVDCQNIDIFGTDIECTYDLTGLTLSVGAQHLTASETPISEIGGDFLCPDEPTLDGLLKTTEERFVQAPGAETGLCKTHKAEKCPDNELVKNVHFLAKNPGWMFNVTNEVKCEESLLKGTVGALARPQTITVGELTWKNCKLNGKDACTVATVENNTWEVGWEKLNLGWVVPKSVVKVTCGTTIVCEVKPYTWKIEGATGAHNGKISVFVNGILAKKGGTCPAPATWFAEYVSVTDKVYVLT